MKPETHLWEQYKKRITKDLEKQTELDAQYTEYLSLVDEISNAHNKFRANLEHLPIGVALRAWMSSVTDKKIAREQVDQILTIIDSKALPLKLSRKDILTLGYLQELGQEAHKQILEEIRCNIEWSIDKKEELVKCYIHFSEYLNEATEGEILVALDPDRAATAHKLLAFDSFIQFVQNVPERDALIAKLLYFGGPSVEDVVRLEYGMINRRDSTINFSGLSVDYPKHLILEILEFVGKKEKGDLLFLNYRGKPVDSPHLSQCFKRVSAKMIPVRKITPRNLLEAKTKLS
jgi:hypothetical protein